MTKFQELLPVNTNSPDRITVSARDLHTALEVETRFNDWFLRMCEYGFEEGKDYCSFLSNRADGLPGKPRKDAEITIEMAKEICMLQRSERGKQARRYFIQLEKDWNSPEKVMARALQIANDKIRVCKRKSRRTLPPSALQTPSPVATPTSLYAIWQNCSSKTALI